MARKTNMQKTLEIAEYFLQDGMTVWNTAKGFRINYRTVENILLRTEFYNEELGKHVIEKLQADEKKNKKVPKINFEGLPKKVKRNQLIDWYLKVGKREIIVADLITMAEQNGIVVIR